MSILYSVFFKNKFRKDIVYSNIAQIIVVVFGFIQIIIINRFFGLEIYGQLAVIMASAGFFTNLVTARTSEATTKFYKSEGISNNKKNQKFVLLLGLFIDSVLGLFLLIIISISSNLIATIFLKNEKLFFEVRLYSFIPFMMFIKGSFLGYFQGKEKFNLINIIKILDAGSKIIFIAVFYLNNKMSLRDLIISLLVSSIFTFLLLLLLYLKYYINEFKNIQLIYNISLFKEYYKFNIRTFFSTTLKSVGTNTDNLILSYFINVDIVGIYQIIKKIISPLQMLIQPIITVTYPKFIDYHERVNKDKFKNTITKINRYISIISIIYLILANLLFIFILAIMDIDYESYYQIFLFMYSIYNFGMILLWWSRNFSNTINPNLSIRMNSLVIFLQLVFGVILTYFIGVYGFLLTQLTIVLFLTHFWRKYFNEYFYKTT